MKFFNIKSKLLRIAVFAVAGIFVLLVIAETALQIWGAYERYQINKRLQLSSGDADRPLVAFVGDSNIYGIYVNENETLPRAVETLSRQGGALGVRCINFGVPGSPTWAVLDQLKRALELKPVAIVARTGINNTWLLPPEDGYAFLEYSKLYKLAKIIFLTKPPDATPGAGGIPEAKPGEPSRFQLQQNSRLGEKLTVQVERPESGYLPFEQARARVHDDYEQMAKLTNNAGVKLIFATYTAGFEGTFRDVRDEMFKMEGVFGATVADCAGVAEKILQYTENPGRALLYEESIARRGALLTRDRHPTAAGYALEARSVGAKLAEFGYIKKESADLDIPSFVKSLPFPPKLIKAPAQEGVFRFHGSAGDRPVLVLGFRGTSLYKDALVPVDHRTLRNQTSLEPLHKVDVTSSDGKFYDFRLDRAFLAKLPPGVFAVAVAERGGNFGGACVFISNTIAITN